MLEDFIEQFLQVFILDLICQARYQGLGFFRQFAAE
jgi:hypothetical protein